MKYVGVVLPWVDGREDVKTVSKGFPAGAVSG